MDKKAFWRHKSLAEMSVKEWESLCDGCGKCCLYKLEDSATGRVHHTNVACYLLNLSSCRCSNYKFRQRLVSDCVKLDPGNVQAIEWLPKTCAYRLVAQGDDLPPWHPLRTGCADSVHTAGISVRSWAVSEQDVDDLEKHIIDADL